VVFLRSSLSIFGNHSVSVFVCGLALIVKNDNVRSSDQEVRESAQRMSEMMASVGE
jgi:hypothetical protein